MRKANILIAEDDPRIVIFLEDQLKSLGHEVVIAHDGIEAIEKVKKYNPELIILDIVMPKMDGYEVCKHLKSSPETKHIKILMLTHKRSDQDVTKGLTIGADDYLPKPYGKTVLEAKVNKLLEELPPFRKSKIGYTLSLSCESQRSIYINLRGAKTYQSYTKNVLDIEVDILNSEAKTAFSQNFKDDENRQNFWRYISSKVGEDLYRKIFDEHKEVYDKYHETYGKLEHPRELHLQFVSNIHFLKVPIEFLFNKKDYLVLRHPLTRLISHTEKKKKTITPEFFNNEIWASHTEFKILLIASDIGNMPLVDEEINILNDSLRELFEEKQIPVFIKSIRTNEATYDVVCEELEKCKEYHVIHYAGHGSFDVESPEKSSIFFWEKPNCAGEIKPMAADQLQMLLQDSETRFVYLSCCRGMETGEISKLLNDNSLGLADSLLTHTGIPAILGFRWNVSDEGAKTLAVEFYKSLAKHGLPELALLDARRKLATINRDDFTWISPILIMQD